MKIKAEKSYVICAVQRSGSFLLCESLKNTGLAGIPEEYFLDGRLWKDEWWIRQYSGASQLDFLRFVFEKGTTANGVFGIKIMWNYFYKMIHTLQELTDFEGMSSPQLTKVLFSEPQYIWIVRRDKVRQAVSWAIAGQTGVYGWPKGETPTLKQEPGFDFNFIDNLYGLILAGEAGWADFFKASEVEPFKVVYEELVEAYEQTALDILEFLHVAYPEKMMFGERRLQKQSGPLNEEWAERYIQIKQQRAEASSDAQWAEESSIQTTP
jgi:LPS sulfotransferase NodH